MHKARDCALLLTAITYAFANCAISGPLDSLARLLPTWPLVNVGDAIPPSTINMWRQPPHADKCGPRAGQYDAFPSKGTIPLPDKNSKDYPEAFKEYQLDKDSLCNDGDQTLYNGLLCASGEQSGCTAVAQAMDATGHWFRSPHRRWMWSTRCVVKGKDALSEDRYNADCANGFSPDMSLGVMLYTLHTHDVSRYRRWLGWINQNADTTELCKLDDKLKPYDCIKTMWPRVCTLDLGYSSDRPPIAINGRYGGNCALRPQDALDFAAVDTATYSTPPKNMNTFEVTSRDLVRAVVGPIPPLLLLSTFEGGIGTPNWATHLDAARVLLRMQILNPSLKLDNLPSIPDFGQLAASALDPGIASGADMVTIHASASLLATRAPWNPFYKLLADGPTQEVHDKILAICPDQSTVNSKAYWLWGENPGDTAGGYAKEKGMGWDCVFVGNLYNTMRVKKNIITELVQKTLAFVDHTDEVLSVATAAFQQAEAATQLEQKAFDEAKRQLDDAQDFVGHLYAQQRAALVSQVKGLTSQLDSLSAQKASLEKQASDKAKQAALLPDTIQQNVLNKGCSTVFNWLGVGSLVCKPFNEIQNVVNQPKRDLLDEADKLNKQAADLQNGAIQSTNNAIVKATQDIADLDKQFATLQAQLQSNTLQAAYNLHKQHLALRQSAFAKGQDALNKAKEAHDQAVAVATVWTSK